MTEDRDWEELGEDVTLHTMIGFNEHDDGRFCQFHSRLNAWTFDGNKKCLRIHFKNTGTRQRPGDQVLPAGDESLVDDQQLLIDDIEERRQVGIERYGQGHRPFNGRDTLQDLYEEQLDLLVYLRSIKRMAEATNQELREVVATCLRQNGFQAIASDAMAGHILTQLQGWVAGNLLDHCPDPLAHPGGWKRA